MSQDLPSLQKKLVSEGILVPTASKAPMRDQIDQKKFEEELEKQRTKNTDADQKNQRKREQEESEGKKNSLHKPQATSKESVKKGSVYDIQTPQKPFTLPQKNTSSSSRSTPLTTSSSLAESEDAVFLPSHEEGEVLHPPLILSAPISSKKMISSQSSTSLHENPSMDVLPPEELKQEKEPLLALTEPIPSSSLQISIKETDVAPPILYEDEVLFSVEEEDLHIPTAPIILPKQDTLIKKADPLISHTSLKKTIQEPLPQAASKAPGNSSSPLSKNTALPPPSFSRPSLLFSKKPPPTEPPAKEPFSPAPSLEKSIEKPLQQQTLPPSVQDPRIALSQQQETAPQTSKPKTQAKQEKRELSEETTAPQESSTEQKVEADPTNIPISVQKETKEQKQTLSSSLSFAQDTSATPSKVLSSYSGLPPSVFYLYEQIAGVLLIVNDKKGLTQTHFFLQGEAFTSSVFFGSQITIEESDSAPKVFNVRLISSSPEAVDLFNKHKKQLEEQLHSEHTSFSVHTIQAELTTQEESSYDTIPAPPLRKKRKRTESTSD